MRLQTSVTISKSPEQVWGVLSNLCAWDLWNSAFTSVRVEPRVGGDVRFDLRIDGGSRHSMRAKLRRLEGNREIAWVGTPLIFPILARAEHWFFLEPAGGQTLFRHGEDFSGLLSVALGRKLRERLRRTYEEFNNALKFRVEALADTTVTIGAR